MTHSSCPKKLCFAVSSINAQDLLGNTHLNFHASDGSTELPSHFSEATQIFYKVYVIYLFKVSITKTVFQGCSQEDLTKTFLILLF